MEGYMASVLIVDDEENICRVIKGLLVKIIQWLSAQKDKLFIKFNCAAIPSGLMEAELFGYKKGAFMGGSVDKPGKFEIADGRTIFLEEIGDIPPELQAKLLSALQDRETTRLGESQPREFSARVIAATNIDLKKAVSEKKFREDLPELMDYFMKKYSAEYGVSPAVFTEKPGNTFLPLPGRETSGSRKIWRKRYLLWKIPGTPALKP